MLDWFLSLGASAGKRIAIGSQVGSDYQLSLLLQSIRAFATLQSDKLFPLTSLGTIQGFLFGPLFIAQVHGAVLLRSMHDAIL